VRLLLYSKSYSGLKNLNYIIKVSGDWKGVRLPLLLTGGTVLLALVLALWTGDKVFLALVSALFVGDRGFLTVIVDSLAVVEVSVADSLTLDRALLALSPAESLGVVASLLVFPKG
jgi:hypothetical protein